MNKLILCLALTCAGSTLIAQPQGLPQTNKVFVLGNLPFFEQLFTRLGSSSAQAQRAQIDQLRFDDTQSAVLLKYVTQFKAKEDPMRQQAVSVLSGAQTGATAVQQLRNIRLARQQLLVRLGIQLMGDLDADAASKIVQATARGKVQSAAQ